MFALPICDDTIEFWTPLMASVDELFKPTCDWLVIFALPLSVVLAMLPCPVWITVDDNPDEAGVGDKACSGTT